MTRRWVGPLFLAASLVFAAVVYASLPVRIPTHWNMRGQVDGWMPRWPGAFLLPVVGVAAWLLLVGLRRVDPRRSHYERFNETYWIFLNVLSVYFALFTVLSLGVALGWPIDMTRAVLLTVAVLFVALGNYMPRIRSNWWMGIRTPWTLESEEVWRKTHRLGGRLFVIGGLVGAVGALLPAPIQFWVAVAGFLLAGLVPVVYSYFAYRSAG
ncbi:MAG TPA: SdpI family protein [Longimicrobiales bacterium]|nr:SdpI family protein [Longimicrobiales bacterium]